MIIQVTRTLDMPETEKLEFIREIGFTHMRISGTVHYVEKKLKKNVQ